MQLNTPHSASAAYAKLRMAIAAMRLLTVGFVVSVFWQIQAWWLDGERVMRLLGSVYGKDLQGMAAWQRHAAMGLDLLALALVVVAVVYCWRFLGTLKTRHGFTEAGLQHLMRCAWWGLGSEALSLLSRPVKSGVLTWHLPLAEREWRFSLQSADIQSIILCLCLLMFGLMFSWALEIAEENQGFV